MKQIVHLPEILGNKKIIKILNFFVENQPKEISQIEIINKLKIAKGTAVKWLKLLVKTNLLVCKKIGVTNLYSLDEDNIIIKQYKVLNTIIKLQELNELSNKDIEIYLYGSASRGENKADSDIDLLIIGKIQRNNIINTLDKLSKRINKKINFTIFNNLEWAKMQKKDKAYYEWVEKDKVKLL